MSRDETALIAAKILAPRLTRFGLGTTRQWVPFQCSTKVCWMEPLTAISPTAHTLLLARAVTPSRKLPFSPGLTPWMVDQAAPIPMLQQDAAAGVILAPNGPDIVVIHSRYGINVLGESNGWTWDFHPGTRRRKRRAERPARNGRRSLDKYLVFMMFGWVCWNTGFHTPTFVLLLRRYLWHFAILFLAPYGATLFKTLRNGKPLACALRKRLE